MTAAEWAAAKQAAMLRHSAVEAEMADLARRRPNFQVGDRHLAQVRDDGGLDLKNGLLFPKEVGSLLAWLLTHYPMA